ATANLPDRCRAKFARSKGAENNEWGSPSVVSCHCRPDLASTLVKGAIPLLGPHSERPEPKKLEPPVTYDEPHGRGRAEDREERKEPFQNPVWTWYANWFFLSLKANSVSSLCPRA